MKKRLRKKLRLGKYQALGFKVTYATEPNLDAALCDALIDRYWAVMDAFPDDELQAWGTGGSIKEGKGQKWEAYLFVPKPYASANNADRAVFLDFLQSEPDIAAFEVSDFMDINHSPDWMGSGEASRYWRRIARRPPRT